MKPGIDFIAHEAAAAPLPKGTPRPWWEGRPFVAAMILLAFVPLLWPTIPPLVDLPGHMGRYEVAQSLSTSPMLQQWFSYEWRPIGNLGVDLLVWPLAKLMGVEMATKLVAMVIPPMTVAGMLWVAREVHNRLPPTVAFALPLAYSYPFLFGFMNFSLSAALALLGFGLWLRLGRLGKSRLRAALFVPISFIIFFAHTFGWGMLGLLCFSAEAVRQHDKGLSWWKAGFRAAYHASAMALPVLVMVLWRTEARGGLTLDWFSWKYKFEYLESVLRDRWEIWDKASAAIIVVVPLVALFHPRLALSRNLVFSALVLSLGFVLLPRVIFGSAYADMRMVPLMLATIVLAIRFQKETDFRLAQTLAIIGVAFLLVRTATTTASLAIAEREHQVQLAALDHVERGAKVATLVYSPCGGWALRRSDHLASMVIVRRHGFANDQWRLAGSSLLGVHFPDARWFSNDPSEIVRYPGCRKEGRSFAVAIEELRLLKPGTFDYLWLLNLPPLEPSMVEGWTKVFSAPGSVLFKLTDDAAPPPATLQTASAPAR